jgi:hypothetical protein
LWVDPTDAERVKQEITATRCKYRSVTTAAGTQAWEPDLPSEQQETAAGRLFDLVEAKQMHSCRTGKGGCLYQRKECKCKFPFQPNHAGTIYDDATKR